MPKLPISEDGSAAMRTLDEEVALASEAPYKLVPLLLERASIRGQLEDYERALSVAGRAAGEHPLPRAQLLLVQAQLRVHKFSAARATLAPIADRIEAPVRADLEVALDQATGLLDRALAARAARATLYPDAHAVTLYAATLAEAGRTDEAIAQIAIAVAHLRNNTPQYIAWLLFQWGRIYEQAGQTALARDHFAEAHRRLPAHVEATEHLVAALIATGDRAQAAKVVSEGSTHPALLAVAAQLADQATRRNAIAAATAAWDRYTRAFPEAFADHAARFYLGIGGNPGAAMELARTNLANRDTAAARALAIEAALAADAAAEACNTVGWLATRGPRRERFIAWRALTVCGRADDAARLARELGIPAN